MSEGKWLNATAGDEKETGRASRRVKSKNPKEEWKDRGAGGGC